MIIFQLQFTKAQCQLDFFGSFKNNVSCADNNLLTLPFSTGVRNRLATFSLLDQCLKETYTSLSVIALLEADMRRVYKCTKNLRMIEQICLSFKLFPVPDGSVYKSTHK